MSGNTHNTRFGVYILPGNRTTQQEHHCTQAILERSGHTAAVFQFPNYQALLHAASTGQIDAIICDSRVVTEHERYFMHLLGEVLWYRYRLCLHHLDSPETDRVNPIYQQFLTRILLAAYGDPEVGVTQTQPFGYVRIEDRQHIIPEQSVDLECLIRSYSIDEIQE